VNTEHFIIDLFCRVDDLMPAVQKHTQARLYPSEVVTLALLFALKGVGNRLPGLGYGSRGLRFSGTHEAS
jgi:hypothetical protein